MSQELNLKRLKYHALACGIGSTAVLSKADEYCRMVDAKGQAFLRQLNFMGESKLIMCLEIAASELGQSFNKKTCFERSGMSSKNYQSALRSIKTILSLQKHSSVRESAVTLGCPQLADAASVLVKRYLQEYLSGDTSLVTNSVSMAALAVVARIEGVTLKASKVTEMAACNRNSFILLKGHMENLSKSDSVDQTKVDNSSAAVRCSPRKRKILTCLNDTVEKNSNRSELFSNGKQAEAGNSAPTDSDSFQIWKSKILANARHRLQKAS